MKRSRNDDDDDYEYDDQDNDAKSSARKQNKNDDLFEEEDADEDENEVIVDHETKLRPDHASRPIWVLKNRKIIAESMSMNFKQVSEFLITIAEPKSRPELIHEYKLTRNSLYTAISLGMSGEDIIIALDRYSKNSLPFEVTSFIRQLAETFGKAKLVLNRNKWFIESQDASVLRKLLENPTIRNARRDYDEDEDFLINEEEIPNNNDEGSKPLALIDDDDEEEEDENDENSQLKKKNDTGESDFDKEGILGYLDAKYFDKLDQGHDQISKGLKLRLKKYLDKNGKKRGSAGDDAKNEKIKVIVKLEDELKKEEKANKDANAMEVDANGNGNHPIEPPPETDMEEAKPKKNQIHVVSFKIDESKIGEVKQEAEKMKFPLIQEYEHQKDDQNVSLPITLKGKLRPYQERALSKMFGNNRARSGIIVLPCGAGKTLTGIAACCNIRKSCIVFCPGSVAVEQWINQFKLYSTLTDSHVVRFTSKEKHSIPRDAVVLFVTYSIMAMTDERRSKESQEVIRQIQGREWGLIILDEVHVVPAKTFRDALNKVKSHCKLGLTATLVREDGKVADLSFLVGPKLYEANWIDLTNEGYLARVLCAEVWCPMSKLFFRKYLEETNSKARGLLYIMNPNKYAVCEMLMKFHEARGDKILIFCDRVAPLNEYGRRLGKDVMHGKTSQNDRERLFRRFRGNGVPRKERINTLLVSSVADMAIDLPEANIIIQIASHFGSRRQEAQRLGRILRPKPGDQSKKGFNAFFYSLVSTDTEEMFFSNRRQQYLVDQGYTYKVIQNINEMAPKEGMKVQVWSEEEQKKVLEDLSSMDIKNIEEDDAVKDDDLEETRKKPLHAMSAEDIALSKGMTKRMRKIYNS